MFGRLEIRTFHLLLFFTFYGSFVTGTVRNVYRNNMKDIKAADIMDVSDFSVYYDLRTNETIKKMMPRPWYKPGWMLRLPFTGGPCECEGMQCRCCTGIRIPAFKFDRQTCAVLTYNDSDSLITMDVQMNNSTVYRNSFSARNPPPFCVPIPVPYLPPGLVDMCVRLFDINVMDQRFHVCMDMDTRVDMAPVLVLHFDCMDMGLNGIGLSKPGGSDTNSSSTNSSMPEPEQMDSDVYDPVMEDAGPTTQHLYNISVKYI